MSAEQPKKWFSVKDDAEIDSLLVPKLYEEIKTIQGGEEKVNALKITQYDLLSKKIIPGLEARRQDLGNFCITFEKNKEKLLVFTEPFSEDEENQRFLVVHRDGVFELTGTEPTKNLLWLYLVRCTNTRREIGVGHDEMVMIFGEESLGRIVDAHYGKVKLCYSGSQDLKFKTDSGSGWREAPFQVFTCFTDSGVKHPKIKLLESELLNLNNGLDLIVARLKELEKKIITRAEMYESGEHPDIVDMESRVQRLQDLSAMLPDPPEKGSIIRRLLHKSKKGV